MGEMIKIFAFDRNTLKQTPEASAESVAIHIELVRTGAPLDRNASAMIDALALYMGIFRKADNGDFQTTPIADTFIRLYRQDKGDAWRWLITRSLWLFVIPNGTHSAVNAPAQAKSLAIAFFPTILGLLMHLQALPAHEHYLYFDELYEALYDDSNWGIDARQLFEKIMTIRDFTKLPGSAKKASLSDLETYHDMSRDNLSEVFSKAFDQTGLFEYRVANGKPIGISVSPLLDHVRQGRIRFVLDHPVLWNPELEKWDQFLDLRSPDLPEEVSLTSSPTIDAEPVSVSINAIVKSAKSACDDAKGSVSFFL